MVILAVKKGSSGCMEITTAEGPSFFIRTDYLKITNAEEVVPGREFSDAKESDIIDSGFIFSAERKAEEYLARCEHCRFGLFRKLAEKGFEKQYIEPALDYLESRNYLSDSRFARSWLNVRRISKNEGRTRLLGELISRGIDRHIAESALDEYFSVNNEKEICRKAYSKLIKTKKDSLKIQNALIRMGFSFKMIQSVMEDQRSQG